MNLPFGPNTENAAPQFLTGGGEMGSLIRSKDWSTTPLGSPDTWPQSLRTAVSLCIASNFPIAIAWGPHRVQIYNDGYWPIPGDMHPASMGQDFKECWISAWPVIGQAFEEASLGETRFLENQRIFLERYGYTEETFFTFSFSPILDESGSVGGLFHPVIEQTQQTLAERRLNILHNIPDHTVNARTTTEASALVAECLKDFSLDIPFLLVYSIADDGTEAVLEGSVGVDACSTLAPTKINFQPQQSCNWPFAEVIKKEEVLQVNDLGKIFGTFTCGPYPEAPHQALIFPITLAGTTNDKYLLVAGVSSRRSLDEKYRLFYELLAEAIKNALVKARAYEEERKKAEALAEIDKAKTAFFSNVSHEFRTPLTLMLGSLEEMLKNGKREEGDKEAVETTHRNALRLLRLVNNLLDFSRIEAGKAKLQYGLTDITKYTADLASNFRSIIESAGLAFHVKTDTVIQPVFIDNEMWEKIVLNLLSNAFKYTLEGSIELLLTTQNNQVVLTVKDTGVGIPEHELPKMFERFHRVQNVTGRTYEGTGIGLSLVKELVGLHGGDIKVSSELGKGTAFTVRIPTGKNHLPKENVVEKGVDFTGSISNAFLEEAASLIEQPFSPNGNGEHQVAENAPTVLIVDDNADMRTYIKSLLQKQYKVITANNGVDALHKIKSGNPDLVLSDVMMPIMDGIQLVKEVKENPATAQIPVILLSARAGEESKIEGYDIGADDYLVKPFSAKELLARVASQINLLALRRATETTIHNLFMQAPALICILRGPQHVYKLANEMYLQFVGNRDIVGKPIREALPELEGQGFLELLDNVYVTGEPFIGNEMPVNIDMGGGKLEEMYMNFVYQPARNGAGEVEGILVHGVDITEQVLARKKIEESEERFRLAFIGSNQVVFRQDKNLMHTWIYNSHPGFKPEDIIGKTDEELHVPHTAKILTDIKSQVLVTGKSFDGDVELEIKGQLVTYSLHFEVTRDANADITGITGIVMDITERVKAEQKIKESEERFRNLADESPMFVFIIEPDPLASVSYWNKTWLNYTGQTFEEANGRAWAGIIHPDDVPIVMDIYVPAFEGQQPYVIPAIRVKRYDGEYRYHIIKSNPRYLSNGDFNGYVGVGIDVHEQKLAEENLKISEERFRTLANDTPAFLFTADADTNIDFVNRQWLEFVGLSQTEGFGKKWEEVTHPDDIAPMYAIYTEAVQNSKPYHFEIRQKNTSGEYRWVLWNGIPRADAEGKLTGIVGLGLDITEQKVVQEIIKASEERFRQLADLVPQILWTARPDGFIDYYNKRWYEYTGYRDGFGDGSWTPFVHPDDLQGLLDAYYQSIQQEIPYKREFRLKEHNIDVYRWFIGQAVPVHDHSGKLIKWFGSCTDIQEQKTFSEKLEAQVGQRTIELQRSNEDLQQFAHVASHDLKEPVRKIKTFTNRLEQNLHGKLDENGTRFIERIHAATNRMFNMIDGVLAYSTINADEQTPSLVDLNEVVKSIETDLEVTLQSSNAIIQFNNLPVVEGAPVLLYQLFYNLINNSIKFAKAGVQPQITFNSEIVTTNKKQFARIIFSDNGIGFDPGDSERIFNSFTRLNSKDKYEGTGLGLSLCRKIAERHGGNIIASGTPGEGATFTIILPVEQKNKSI